MKPVIFIVDDDANISRLIKLYLEQEGYEVRQFLRGDAALAAFRQEEPALMLLDIMLPGMDGWEVCREVRQHSRLPIIMLSAKEDTFDKVKSLELGADDYITKPFSPRELLARIKAVLRRRLPEMSDEILEMGGLRLDPTTHRVHVYASDAPEKLSEITLGPTEFRLLHFLMAYKERVHTRSQLLDRVWGDHVFIEDRTVDVHIRRLRKILETAGKENLVQTVRGTGYRFSVECNEENVE